MSFQYYWVWKIISGYNSITATLIGEGYHKSFDITIYHGYLVLVFFLYLWLPDVLFPCAIPDIFLQNFKVVETWNFCTQN